MSIIQLCVWGYVFAFDSEYRAHENILLQTQWTRILPFHFPYIGEDYYSGAKEKTVKMTPGENFIGNTLKKRRFFRASMKERVIKENTEETFQQKDNLILD